MLIGMVVAEMISVAVNLSPPNYLVLKIKDYG